MNPATARHLATAIAEYRERHPNLGAIAKDLARIEASTNEIANRQQPPTTATDRQQLATRRMALHAPNMPAGADLLDYDQASEIFGVGRRTLERWVKEDRVPSAKIGGKRLFSRAELLAFVRGDR